MIYKGDDLVYKISETALIQYRNPKNYDLVYEALMKAGRQDLIGFDKKCLIKPRKSFKKSKPVAKKKTIRNVHKKKR